MADPSASFFERMRNCSAAGSQGPACKDRRPVRRSVSAAKLDTETAGATGLVCRMECLGSGPFLPGKNKAVCSRREQTRAAEHHARIASSQQSSSSLSNSTQAPRTDNDVLGSTGRSLSAPILQDRLAAYSTTGSDDPSRHHEEPILSDNGVAERSQDNRDNGPRSRQKSNSDVASNNYVSFQEDMHVSSRPFESRFVVAGAIGVGSSGRVFKVFERRRNEDAEDLDSRALACKAIKLHPSEGFAEVGQRLKTDRACSNASLAAASRNLTALEEVRMLKTFSGHPSFLEFKENSFSECGRVCYIVTQFAHGGDLSRFLEDRGPITEQKVRQIVLCVLEGLARMHEHGIAHRDLKLENILILNDGNLDRVVLGDLGMAKHLDAGPAQKHFDLAANATTLPCSGTAISDGSDTGDAVSPLLTGDNDNEEDVKTVSYESHYVRAGKRHSICGNPMHMAPEMLQQPTRTSKECQRRYNDYDSECGRQVVEYDLKVDIWACGVIMYRLLSGKYPFQPSSSGTESHSCDGVVEIFRAINNGEYSLSGKVWDGVSESGKDLLQKLLTYDAAKRPTAREAINHSWFVASK